MIKPELDSLVKIGQLKSEPGRGTSVPEEIPT
jgi:hypothetical protein